MKPAPYKDVTLQQLRSFCATARHGSLTAAAAALDLAHPTVWKQVHALEQTFGTKLVEPHARGCRLTEAGEVLRGLTEPSVTNLNLGELKTRFAELLGRANVNITIAAPPRILAGDLMGCIAAFVRTAPRARFTLRESNGDEVAGLVDAGLAALGFTAHIEDRGRYPALSFERWYELDLILITPRDHPLARRRRVRPEDLKPYPLVDARLALHDTLAHEALVRLGLYETEPRWAEARHVEVIRRCVELGLGIALVTGLWSQAAYPTLHARVMRQFGRTPVYLVRRAGAQPHAIVAAFAEEVRARLAPRRKGR